jgi:hypothetical protein
MLEDELDGRAGIFLPWTRRWARKCQEYFLKLYTVHNWSRRYGKQFTQNQEAPTDWHRAAGFVVPKITARSAKYLAALKTEDYVDFGTFFDRDHLVSSLREGCPQMKLYNDSNGLWHQPTTASPFVIIPKNLAEDFVNLNFYDVLTKPEKRGQFDSWLDDATEGSVIAMPSCPLIG